MVDKFLASKFCGSCIGRIQAWADNISWYVISPDNFYIRNISCVDLNGVPFVKFFEFLQAMNKMPISTGWGKTPHKPIAIRPITMCYKITNWLLGWLMNPFWRCWWWAAGWRKKPSNPTLAALIQTLNDEGITTSDADIHYQASVMAWTPTTRPRLVVVHEAIVLVGSFTRAQLRDTNLFLAFEPNSGQDVASVYDLSHPQSIEQIITNLRRAK